ncbi:helix-turn-helix domain-containing protein [Halobacterium sp. R2-5]|uniref:ArsR/SmtB family transcription factor n=1 Tax=Halobacterium sp. R2-5 TaxID=2715751 RepID=UPI0014223A58|nr:helix-turn-helix domain-containing protein [Halobacterium sp. R2-5]NIC00968.1 helix-turn-helix transcriptional regulator [Halobacterium sp. R2-5]
MAEDAADVFALLSDDTRVDVLRAVAQAERETELGESGPVELSFSDIYERVAVDNTSKLSYHLGELTGTFLRKSERGYALTHAGEYMVRFVLSENYGTPEAFGPVEVAGRCPFCAGTELVAELFEQQIFLVKCRACERPVAGLPTTPAQTRDWGPEEYVESMATAYVAQVRQMRRGVCPTCFGRVIGEVVMMPENPTDYDYVVELACESCLRSYSMALPYAVVGHPASVVFHWERGVDVTQLGFWELHDRAYVEDWAVEERAGGEGYEVSMELEGDLLRLVVDGAVGVVESETVVRGRS